MKNEISNAASVLGRKGGSVKSEAKTKAARENGKRGGRPRTVYIDWTSLGPGAEPEDAERFASFIRERRPDWRVVVGVGPESDETRHAVNELFGEWLAE